MAQLNEVRPHPEGFDIARTSSNVPDCLASILDKKVEGVALNCLEAFVDWLLTHLYDAYNTLYGLKCALNEQGMPFADSGDYDHSGDYSVWHTRSGMPVYDLTEDQNAMVTYSGLAFMLQIRALPIPLKFSQSPAPEPVFSREDRVDRLAIRNNVDAEDYQVSAHYNDRNIRRWNFHADPAVIENLSMQERRAGLRAREVLGQEAQPQALRSLNEVLEQRGLANLPLTNAVASSQGINICYAGNRKVKLEQKLKGITGESAKRHPLYINDKDIFEHTDGGKSDWLEFNPLGENHFVLLTDFKNPRKPTETRYLIIEPGKSDRELVLPMLGNPFCRPPLLADPKKTKAKK